MTAHPQFSSLDPADRKRLDSQLVRLELFTRNGAWFTLAELAKAVGASEAGISARLRELRTERGGYHVVERERVRGGLYRYRVLPVPAERQMRLL